MITPTPTQAPISNKEMMVRILSIMCFSFADIWYILFLAKTGRYLKSRTLKLALPKVVVKPTEF